MEVWCLWLGRPRPQNLNRLAEGFRGEFVFSLACTIGKLDQLTSLRSPAGLLAQDYLPSPRLVSIMITMIIAVVHNNSNNKNDSNNNMSKNNPNSNNSRTST